MNQAADLFDLKDEPHCVMPPEGTQCHALLVRMRQGYRFTVLSAITDLGIYALSQRCGELRRDYGWPIQSQTLHANGKSFSEYWMNP